MDPKLEVMVAVSCCLQPPTNDKCVNCPFYEVDNCKDAMLKCLAKLIK